ncbi:MAG: alpha/beta fold hydrolase [Usitatibacter sp.]
MNAPLPHAVLLHGVNATSRSMEPLAAGLRKHATVHIPNLPGHGGRPIPERMSIQDTGVEMLQLLDDQGIERAWFVGYSLGGYTATWLAHNHPDRVLGVCTLATRFTFTPEIVSHWTHLAQPERIQRNSPARAAELLRSHGPDWPRLSFANAAMFEELDRNPPLTLDDLKALTRPVMLVNGNRDAFLPWVHTLEMGKVIPGAKLVMFYGIAHPIMNVPTAQVAEAIGQWMRNPKP